jgi:hypothetical protein
MGSRISQEQDRIGGQASVAARMPNQKHRTSVVLIEQTDRNIPEGEIIG